MLTLETIICTFSVLSVAARADFKTRNCSEVREACVGKGFSFAHVPLQEIPGKVGLIETRQLGSRLAKQNIINSLGNKHGLYLMLSSGWKSFKYPHRIDAKSLLLLSAF